MRQPLEDKQVTIARAKGSLTFPANFMLIAAMNPCPCGYATDPVKECTCSPGTIAKYQQRISGPMMDRFDIFLEVPRVEFDKLTSDRLGEPSSAIRARVEGARRIQQGRFEHLRDVNCNGDMGVNELRLYGKLDNESHVLLKSAAQQLHLSARAYHRVLKLARTIADLDGKPVIGAAHIAEALQYRYRR